MSDATGKRKGSRANDSTAKQDGNGDSSYGDDAKLNIVKTSPELAPDTPNLFSQPPSFFTPNMGSMPTPVLGKRKHSTADDMPAMSPGVLPRRSPRLNSLLTTPTFSMPSPTLPSIFTTADLGHRRSPRLLAKDTPFSPSAFFQSPGMTSQTSSDQLNALKMGQTPTFSQFQSGAKTAHINDRTGSNTTPSYNNMSILNKLQQQNNRSDSTSNSKWKLMPSKKQQKREQLSSKLKSPSTHGAMLPGAERPLHLSHIKSSGNGSGSSCHQCKSRRSMNNLIFCCNMFNKHKDKRRSGNKDKRHTCRKKYCDQCLMKFYHEKAPIKRQDPNSTWQCPACRGICCCAACRRQKAKLQKTVDPLRMSPATSLATGLVYFKDMLKFKLGESAASSPGEIQKAIQDMANDQGLIKPSSKSNGNGSDYVKRESH